VRYFVELRKGEVRILGILGSWISTLRSSTKFGSKRRADTDKITSALASGGRSVDMSEERVVKLEFYEDSAPYEGPRSPASPEELSEAIRRIHERNLDALLWVYIGGDPEKAGYPVIPWL
jgi:hypothetical protein